MSVRRRLASLTSRLVVTAVLLVVAVSMLIGTAATVAMHNRLTAQVDDQVLETSEPLTGGRGDSSRGEPLEPGNIAPDTVIALYPDEGPASGRRFGRGPDNSTQLSAAVLDELGEVEPDGRLHGVDLTALDGYRVRAVALTDGVVVVGRPTHEVDEAVASLIGYELGFIALGAVVAGGVGLLVVRRQLGPLREVAATAERVAELPLSSGEIELTERVPAHLTDEATEVGQVGASLNTLLSHVESSLESRHRSEQQVRQFVADASHELRTPLATIKGYAELARRRPDDAAGVLMALDKVEAESGRMSSLVEDLLLLARIDAGRPLERKPVDLSRLLVEAVSDTRVLSTDHQWRLDLPETAVQVVGDEQRLHQLVTNLLTNARKHTPAGTTVTVAARPGVLTVHDDGPGFPPALVRTAFERFARADTARTRTPESGAGLGLALVEAIAGAHGGSVALTSAPGDTTVTVLLPQGHPEGQTDP